MTRTALYVVSLALAVALAGCSAAGILGAVGSTQARAAQAADGMDEMDAVTMVMTALTAIVNDIAGNERSFTTALMATIVQMDLGATLRNEGEEAALTLLCSAPAPADMPPAGVSIRATEDSAAVEGGEGAPSLVVSSEATPTGDPIVFELAPTDDEQVEVRVRGGGWLLCALFEADLEVDGAPWEMPLDPEVQPTLDVAAWQPEEELDPDEATYGDLLVAVEVVFATLLPAEAVVELLSAERLTFWVGDEPVEVSPLESEPAQRFRAYLLGDEESP